MLSRRLIRIKVMQALYAYYQSESLDAYKSEKDLFSSLNKIYESYLYLLQLLIALSESARIAKADAVTKHISSNTNTDHTRFIEHPILQALATNNDLKQKSKQYKISLQNEHDLIQKLFNKLRKTEEYRAYATGNEGLSDKDLILWLVKKIISTDEFLNTHLEERYIYWNDDKDFVISMITKTLKNIAENPLTDSPLPNLYKDEEDDTLFAKELFKKTISNDAEYEKAIAEKAANWDSERIALTDMILMKMCLTEICTFSQIPVKVSINESLDIAKNYSTPKSNTFINGIIDKIIIEWKANGKFTKTGRGLIEN